MKNDLIPCANCDRATTCKFVSKIDMEIASLTSLKNFEYLTLNKIEALTEKLYEVVEEFCPFFSKKEGMQ